MKILKTKDFNSYTWSGGTATEVYIYPTGSSYANRDFSFRLSSARVEIESSIFTKVANYSRQLMVLDGLLTISHKDRYEKKLDKFQVDSFKGDWDTIANGKVKDFNLMLAEEYSGSIKHRLLVQNASIKLKFDPSLDFVAFYVVRGRLLLNNTKVEVGEESLIVCDSTDSLTEIVAIQDSDIIEINISYPTSEQDEK